MPSYSYRLWRTKRTRSLDEIAQAHALIGGPARGRRHATQQLNRAYAVLLASQFQGFCRDLHSECVDHVLSVIQTTPALKQVLKEDMMRGRQLDRGNAQSSSLGADFGRFDNDFWQDMEARDQRVANWRLELDLLNHWRNAIVHQDFTSPKLGGIINLRLKTVQSWRANVMRLAREMDAYLFDLLLNLTRKAPW